MNFNTREKLTDAIALINDALDLLIQVFNDELSHYLSLSPAEQDGDLGTIVFDNISILGDYIDNIKPFVLRLLYIGDE